MKKLSKLLCTALAAAMLATAVTGCGDGSNPSSGTPASTGGSSASTGGEENPYAEHMEITIGSWDLDYDVDPNVTDPLYQSILDKFNISIKTMNTTWDDYIQKIQTWAAGVPPSRTCSPSTPWDSPSTPPGSRKASSRKFPTTSPPTPT